MKKSPSADVIVYICHNCIPAGGHLPRQWMENGARIQIQHVPCSGKIDTQYLFHALEGGSDGIFVIACSRGECRLGQGNYRAEIRIKTVQRLLSEIGLESKRIELMHSSPDVTADELMQAIQEAAGRFSALGANPIRAAI